MSEILNTTQSIHVEKQLALLVILEHLFETIERKGRNIDNFIIISNYIRLTKARGSKAMGSQRGRGKGRTLSEMEKRETGKKKKIEKN